MDKTYDAYVEHMQKNADINHAMAVLGWDKEVNMPIGGSNFRSRQLSTLAGISHDLFTDKAFGDLMMKLNDSDSMSPKQRRNIEISLKDYQKATKFERKFVEQKSLLISKGYQAWIEARKENNYTLYQNALQALIDITKEEAQILGYSGHPYDAMLVHRSLCQ